MRVTKIGAGIVLAAAILLTGCSAPAAEETADETSATAEATEAPTTDCPELTEGATVDGTALGECITEAMTDSAGYAAKMTVLGMETTAQYDPATESVAWSTPMGSVVVIGGDAWVKSSTSEWQVADPESSDPIVAGLSQAAATANDADPAVAAAALSGEFTVTGMGSRLGQDVYILTGTAEQEGVSVEMTYEITADYVVLATTGATEAAGQSIETSLEITEWDVKQEIVAPV
ncbi:hypothetical protein [Microbacterium sp. NPDC089695]|uniref:hypothetical protein n=1 Tax=Microbacterium sp. NPDC089695 TaxID=3364198 RepID=UPI0037F69E53